MFINNAPKVAYVSSQELIVGVEKMGYRSCVDMRNPQIDEAFISVHMKPVDLNRVMNYFDTENTKAIIWFVLRESKANSVHAQQLSDVLSFMIRWAHRVKMAA